MDHSNDPYRRWFRAATAAWALLLVPCLKPATAADNAHGVHGMILFGDRHQFASHLPLFRHPHHFQVVLRIDFESSMEAVLEGLRAEHALLTIVPQPLDLMRLADGPHQLESFRADVYGGHFERGGKLELSDANVRVVEVVLFREIDLPSTPTESFFAFSDNGEGYLIRQVGIAPDYDQILRADLGSACCGWIDLAAPRSGVELRAGSGGPLEQLLADHGVNIVEEIYLETSDLNR